MNPGRIGRRIAMAMGWICLGIAFGTWLPLMHRFRDVTPPGTKPALPSSPPALTISKPDIVAPPPVAHVMDVNSLQGTWLVTRVEVNGTPVNTGLTSRFTFKGSMVSTRWQRIDGMSGGDTSKYQLDLSAVPARLTFGTPASRALCKFERGRLLLASLGKRDAPFPKGFTANKNDSDAPLVVQVLERENSAAPPAPDAIASSARVSALPDGWRDVVQVPSIRASADGFEIPPHRLIACVKQGWLVVRSEATSGQPEWEIVLGRADRSTPPKLQVDPRFGFVSVEYGQYYVRENCGHLRVFRQRKQEDDWPWPTPEDLPEPPTLMMNGAERLFLYSADEWLWAVAGRSEKRPDLLIRLQHGAVAANASKAVQLFGDAPLTIVSCGDMHCQDDGDLFIATRMPAYAAEDMIRRARLLTELKSAPPPPIKASQWINSPEPLQLEQLRGKVVLLDFWGVWCQPCVKNLPVMEAWHRKFRDQGLVVIGIHSSHQADQLHEFVAQSNVSFPVCVDDGTTAKAYGIDSWPTYLLIDKAGRVVAGPAGVPPSDAELELLVRQAADKPN